MSRENLLISTPDLRQTALTQFFDNHFESFLAPRLRSGQSNDQPSTESQIAKLNQRILVEQQKSWYQLTTVPEAALKRDDYQASAESILGELNHKAWMLHDPLLVHTLPLWASLTKEPELIFYFSEPLRCAHSLQQAWRFPLSFGLALWEHYVLTAANSLAANDCILISDSHVGKSTQVYLEPILDQLGIPQPSDWSLFSKEASLVPKHQLDLPQQTSSELYSTLINGELNSLKGRALSAESQDILLHYGALRSGFDMVKDERDQLRMSPVSSKQESLEIDTAADCEEEPTGAEEVVCKVKVHIQGMEMLELYTEADSPVLTMLRDRLACPEPNQLIFLNYGNDHHDALYFMASDLLALETEPATL